LQVILSFLFKIGYISVAVITLFHYNENPILTVIIALICLLFFLVTGRDEIILYSELLEYRSGSVLKVIRKKKEFKIADIKRVSIEGTYSTGDELYNPKISKDKSLNKIKIELKNGEFINIQTSVYIDKLKKIEIETNKLLTK
jgi:hypothetical protein